jgi:hypothetical protein
MTHTYPPTSFPHLGKEVAALEHDGINIVVGLAV